MTDESIKRESYGSPPLPSTDLRIAVVGLGRAGSALAREFVAAGLHVVGTWNRRTGRAPVPDVPHHVGPLGDLRLDADVYVLAVLDGAITEVAAALPASDAVLLHLSGATESADLDPGRPGLAFGGYHPLQSFRPQADLPFTPPPYCLALDGHPDALAAGRRLAEATGHPLATLPPGGKAAYHAAAVLASNLLVALQAAADRAMQRAGVPPEQSWALLWPLVAGTVANLRDGRFAESLTGPVPRGDDATVARNLAALGDDPAADLYRILAEEALDLARAQGLSDERVEAVRAALARP